MKIMNLRSFSALLAVVLLSACNQPKASEEAADASIEETMTVEAPALNTLSQEEIDQGWTSLFDGQTTEHWRGYLQESFPSNGWMIHEGALVLHKNTNNEENWGGDIITKEQYENFELSLEFMLTDSTNSGILYMVQEKEGDPVYYGAPEYQLLDDDLYLSLGENSINDKQKTGSNYDMEAPSGDHLKPMGEWNVAKILMNEKHIEHWLNDVKVLEYDLGSDKWNEQFQNSKFVDWPYAKITKGHIGLQDHDHEIKFRNIKIRNL